jgi:hypothetical protein
MVSDAVSGGWMTMTKFFVAVCPAVSDAVTAMAKEPDASGVPVNAPVDAIATPIGSAPDVMV